MTPRLPKALSFPIYFLLLFYFFNNKHSSQPFFYFPSTTTNKKRKLEGISTKESDIDPAISPVLPLTPSSTPPNPTPSNYPLPSQQEEASRFFESFNALSYEAKDSFIEMLGSNDFYQGKMSSIYELQISNFTAEVRKQKKEILPLEMTLLTLETSS